MPMKPVKIKWDEPLEFSRAFVESTVGVPPRWKQVVAGIIAAGVVAGLTWGFARFFFWLHKKDLGVPTYFYFVAPPIAGLFVAFFIPMVMSIPSKIILTEQGVHRNKAIGTHVILDFWPWESITHLSIEDMRCGEGMFRVLVVRSNLESKDILIGLGAAPVADIYDLAAQVGKTLLKRTCGAASNDAC